MKSYQYTDIKEALLSTGIKKDDSIFIHSNIGYFGKLIGCSSADKLCEAFFNSFMDILGENGTLVVPTFTYSFCHGEIYDIDKTTTQCGIFAEYIRKYPGSIRSLDPNFSVAAYGKEAVFFTQNHAHESFGNNCFWERFLSKNGKIVCLNFDSGSTFIHYLEKLCNVSYRYNKAFNGIIQQNGKLIRDYAVHYVYDLNKPETSPNFSKLDIICKQAGITHTAPLGRGIIHTMSTPEYSHLIKEYLKKDPFFLTNLAK